MYVNLGTPYEDIMEEVIAAQYAGNKTEVLRQALLVYKEKLSEREELRLVKKAIDQEMNEFKKSGRKAITLEELEKKYDL